MPKSLEQKKHDSQIKEIARIQGLKGEKQWKAAQQFALDNNPALANEHQQHLRELEELREELANPSGKSKSGSIRFSLSIPETIMSVIQRFDPEFMNWDKTKYKTPSGSNVMARKLMRVFPEYKIPTVG